MTGKAYTMKEMKAIVNYLVEHKAYGEIRGRKMWMDFASSKETTRTWQSLKETFLKRILPDINNPYYKLSLIQIASFKQASDMETKLQNKLNVEPVDKEISSNENGHSEITDVEVNTEKNINNEEHTLPGEERLIPQIIMDNRASTETLVLEKCYETAEDIQKELEQSDKEEQTSNPANKGTETSIPIPPNLVQVLKDFASDDENNDELKQAETETSNKKKTETELIVISDSEEKVKSSDQKTTEQADTDATKELDNEKAGGNPKNTSNSILSENDADTVKNIKSNKEELPDKSKNLTQNSSNTTVDTQLPNNPEELNKNSDKGDLNKKSPATLSLNDRKRNMKRATSADAPTKRAKIQQSVSDTDAVKNIKNNEVIVEQAINSEKQDQSNDAQIVNLDAPLDTNEKSAKIGENTSPAQVEMQIPPQIENPCLKSVNLYEEQFSCTIYSDSDDVQIDKNFDSKKITESVLKPQTSKRKAMVINSNSNPSSTTEGQIKNKSVLRILEKKQRDKALAHTFGFSNNAAFGNRKRRHSYTKRRSTSRHRTLKISSDSSDSSSDTESEFISPPRARKNRGNKRYLKPKSARIHSLEEEGGLFVMHGKKIYPVVKDGKILKNYLTYESDGNSDEDTSYWKLKYVEEKKKADELAKLLKHVKNSNSVVPEATTTTDVDVCSENTKKQREMVKTSMEPTTSETKSTEPKEDRTVKIKITKNNEEVELEGHWTHINPVLQQIVQMMKKTGPSGSEKQMPPPGTEHATRGLRQSTSDPISLSGVSTPVDKVKNRINAIESEIFKEIEDLDKEAEPEPAVNQSNDTAQRKSSRQKKSPTKKASVTSPKMDKANKEEKPAEVPEVPVTRRSSRTSKQVLNENTQENAATTRKRSPRKAQNTATAANPEVRYKLPARGKRPPRARYTIKAARIYSSPDNLSLNSEETTQGYVDTDGSPAICLRKKRKTSLSSRNDSNHIRKKSVPSITEDMSSESSISFVTAPIESKTFTNSSLSSQIYRSDSYQLLMPKNKNSPKHLDQIDELSLNSNDGEILHYKSKQASETEQNNFDIDINFNEINYNIDNDQYCNLSLPTSPVLSVVENISVSKSLLSSISENYGDNPNLKVTLNELMSEADVSMPLMERNYTVKKKCEVGTKYHCSLQEPSITDSFINKICTVQIEDISDSISSKLRNLLIESTKKIVTKIKTGEDDKNLETAPVAEEPVVKANKSKAKRSSTPRKRPNVRKPKASIPDPYIEEHTEACSLAGRKSCPPIIHVTDVDKPIKDAQQNQEAKKVSTVKEKKKKDIIKVKITKPANKRKSKVDYQDIIHTNEEHLPNGNGTNDTESGIFLQGLNDSVDLIHNHSDTCLQAHDCIDDHSVEIIEPSPRSIITIDSNSMNAEKDLSHYLHVNEQIALELMSNDAQDCTDIMKVLNSTKSKSIATTTASTLNTTAASPNSLITEDLSVENVLSGTPRSHNWYLLSEEENSTNFKELKNIEPISVSYGANLNHIFPITYAVPNLSTVTEMSKDGDDTNSKNVNIA